MKPRVFMFERVKQDTSGLYEFGDIVYIFNGSRRSLFDSARLTQDVIDTLTELQFNPDVDYIVTTGHIIAVSILASAAASFYGAYKALLYDVSTRCYVPCELGTNVTSDSIAG